MTMFDCIACQQFVDQDVDVNIQECQNGHLLCQLCLDENSLTSCPLTSCKTSLHVVSSFAKKCIENAPRKCKYIEFGCKELGPKSHWETCRFRLLVIEAPDVLITACRKKFNDIVKILLEELDQRPYINLNYSDKSFSTALIASCQAKNEEAVALLLKSPKASLIDFNTTVELRLGILNEIEKDKWTAFMIAVAYGLTTVVKLFVEAHYTGRLNIDIPRPSQNLKLTPFHQAAYSLQGDKFRTILTILADFLPHEEISPFSLDVYELSPLDHICSLNSEFQLKTASIKFWVAMWNSTPGIKETIARTLIRMCEIGYWTLVEFFLAQNWITASAYESAMAAACKQRQLEVIRTLLNKDKLPFNSYPFEKAVRKEIYSAIVGKLTDVLEVLIQESKKMKIDLKKINDQGDKKFAPFVSACRIGHFETVKILLKNWDLFDLEAAPSILSDDNVSHVERTGFQWACSLGYENIVHAILETMKTNSHLRRQLQSGFMLACEKGQATVIARFLREDRSLKINLHRVDGYDQGPLHLAVRSGNARAVAMFTRLFAINCVCSNLQQTAFHVAVQLGHLQILQLFEEAAKKNTINLNIQDRNGMTGFHLACESGSIEVFKYLLSLATKNLLDAKVKDSNGNLGFHLALKNTRKNEVVALLLTSGLVTLQEVAEDVTFIENAVQFNVVHPNGQKVKVVWETKVQSIRTEDESESTPASSSSSPSQRPEQNVQTEDENPEASDSDSQPRTRRTARKSLGNTRRHQAQLDKAAKRRRHQ